jgi:uncharacterized damage-inducible protein DinB
MINELLDRYKIGISQLKEAVEELDDTAIRSTPIHGKWSVLECVCHIVDFELVFIDRMKRVVGLKNNPLLFTANENSFAQNLFYHKRNLYEEVYLFEASRRHMLTILNELKHEDFFHLSGIHTEVGRLTLLEIFQKDCHHFDHHFEFLMQKVKLLK